MGRGRWRSMITCRCGETMLPRGREYHNQCRRAPNTAKRAATPCTTASPRTQAQWPLVACTPPLKKAPWLDGQGVLRSRYKSLSCSQVVISLKSVCLNERYRAKSSQCRNEASRWSNHQWSNHEFESSKLWSSNIQASSISNPMSATSMVSN